MKGFTNSLSLGNSSGLGGGDVVYALNNTGAPLIAGQKVWLNKHNIGNEDTQYTSGLYNQHTGAIGIWGTANDEVLAVNGNGRSLFAYTSSSKTWARSGLSDTGAKATSIVYNKENAKYYCHYINNKVGFSDNSSNFSCFEISKDSFGDTAFNGYIINDDLELIYSATGIYKIQKRADQSLIKELNLTDLGETIFSVLYDNGVLMVTTSKDDITYFLRYSLIKSEYFGYSCELIDSQQTDVLKANSKIISYATGLDVGDYLFAKAEVVQLSNNPISRLFIYKITEQGLIVANDLPGALKSIAQTSCTAWFDNRTNRLYIGLANDILLFQYAGGKFNSVDLNIIISDYATPKDKCFTFSASDDLTTIYVSYSGSNGSKVTLLRFNAATNDWFADPYSLIADTSLIGFATGKTDAQGRYEVVTLLPDALTLTLNISPDVAENELTFIGGVNDN